MFLTHRQVVPAEIAARIAIESEDELHRPTFEQFASMGYLDQSAEWDQSEHGESAARGYAFGTRLRADEERADALRDELMDLAQRMMRAAV
jgi:Asp-tRNA(Asn)/Glu-tRNA(Gln) amidotransferase C subunit